jgi:very-short-patch-repair endonuclease
VDRLIAVIAGGQDGVISLAQLYELGLTYDDVRWRVAKGWLHPLYRGVFAVGHAKVSATGRLRAALMTLAPTSFLSGRTGAADYGLRPLNLRAIEVTVIADRTPKRDGLIVHRTGQEPHRSEVKVRRGLRVASVPRILVELAPRETPDELLRLITVAVRKGCLDFKAMEEALHRHERRPGLGTLKDVYARYRPGPDRKSGLERSFDAYAATDPRIPRYDKNVRMGPYEFDCVWNDHAVVLELDGRPYHRALADTDNDNAKDIWLRRRGLTPIRINDFRWEYDRAAAVDDLLALLALGARRSAA